MEIIGVCIVAGTGQRADKRAGKTLVNDIDAVDKVAIAVRYSSLYREVSVYKLGMTNVPTGKPSIARPRPKRAAALRVSSFSSSAAIELATSTASTIAGLAGSDVLISFRMPFKSKR